MTIEGRHGGAQTAARRLSPARAAVSAMFFMNGMVVGSWAPVIPEFAARLAISPAVIGLMILAFGVGSLVMMPIVGASIARTGSASITRFAALFCAAALLAVALSPNVMAAAVAVFFFGGMVGGMDVAMNANAVVVEKALDRAIMSSCHGFWSLGGLVGAAVGGPIIALAGQTGHAVAVAVVGLAIAAAAWPFVSADRPQDGPDRPRARLPRRSLPYLLGMIAFFSMVPEGAILDWGALFLRQEHGAGLSLSGLAFAAFSATMAMMRFLGDVIRDRLGAVRTLRLSAAIAVTGMLCAGFSPSAGGVIAGFAIAGIGIANMVPIAFSAAGNAKGLAPGVGIAVATVIGYSGILVAPSLIGWIAEWIGFKPVFLALPGLLAIVFFSAALARDADRDNRSLDSAG